MDTLISLKKKGILIFDGGMGTSIQKHAQKTKKTHPCNELLNLDEAESVRAIHKGFIESGCDIIETNTFGASPLSLGEYGLEGQAYEINFKGASLAREAAAGYGKKTYIAGSVGPTGLLPSLGHTDFDTMYASFRTQCEALIDGGADLLFIETCQDLLQAKCAVIAAYDAAGERDIPVSVSVTVEKGRLMTGSDMESVITALSPFPLFSLGLNCGNGFNGLEEALSALNTQSPFDISLLPNAGIPEMRDGRLIYGMSPEEFAEKTAALVSRYGISMAGGCCGTTPDHINALKKATSGLSPVRRDVTERSRLSSLFRSTDIKTDRPPFIIAERANTQGSKRFRELLALEDFDAMTGIAAAQEAAGAAAVDVCCVFPGRDEAADLSRFTGILNGVLKTPICIDSVDPDAVEAALKTIGGRPLINSVSLKDPLVYDKVFKTAKRFGAAIICLAMDEKGMAATADEKLRVAGKILAAATGIYGLKPHDLFFDFLTFSVAADTGIRSSRETLLALSAFKKEHPEINTILGISNVSHGLAPYPRKILNSLFLKLAVERGLDAAIIHAEKLVPLSDFPAALLKAGERLLTENPDGDDTAMTEFINGCAPFTDGGKSAPQGGSGYENTVAECVIRGRKSEILPLLEKETAINTPSHIIEKMIIPAMEEVGRLFEENSMQLPFVLRASETAKKAMDYLEDLNGAENSGKGSVLLATVKGDVHDIGKNLSAIIFKNHGYRVTDIGVDKDCAEILAAALEHKPDYIGLSGLLASSAVYFGDVLRTLDAAGLDIPVICGGAALTEDYTYNHLARLYGGEVFKAKDAFHAIGFFKKRGKQNGYPGKRLPGENTILTDASPASTDSGPLCSENASDETTIAFSDLLPYINRKMLYKIRWLSEDDTAAEEDFVRLWDMLCGHTTVRGVYRSFSCNASGNSVTLYNPDKSKAACFEFPRTLDHRRLSIADYFLPESSGKPDSVTLFMVTAGSGISEIEKRMVADDEYLEYFLLHGLGVEIAESAARYVNGLVNKITGIESRRYGFGYPACPELKNQKVIFELLDASRLGISITDSYELIPELSTGGFIIHNADAEYFTIAEKGAFHEN